MGANPATARRLALARWQIAGLVGAAGLATGATGTIAWRIASRDSKPASQVSADEARLLAKAQEAELKRQDEAKKLKQAEVGSGYQVDPEGNLVGQGETSDLPPNQSLDEVGARRGGIAAEIAKGIHAGRRGPEALEEEAYAMPGLGRRNDGEGQGSEVSDEKAQRAELARSMLGYSTVKAAKWAALKPEVGEEESSNKVTSKEPSTTERAIGSAEERLATLRDTAGVAGPGLGTGPAGGMWPGGSGAGPSKSGSDLMPAEEHAQPFTAGEVGDMRIGGGVGPEEIVRQGKFVDCVIVNEVRADLMESPVIGMVSRDFVSLDGQYVLVPAGAKLIGSAGRVQNLQQVRVYLRFDRVLFPDQRSAYFPVRHLPALDGAGAVGVEGEVDRHFMLMFGSAVMLGMLDGLAAAVEGVNPANPTLSQLIAARTSMNTSQVVAGILARYGNVVPTITVEPGSTMKVFFAEDVRMTPYMRSGDLTWVKRGGGR
jgi:type IV secretory pathway VirB10-like protein